MDEFIRPLTIQFKTDSAMVNSGSTKEKELQVHYYYYNNGIVTWVFKEGEVQDQLDSKIKLTATASRLCYK